jgi:DNA invertase Pin-like site-specific DNA recombinase
MSKPILVAIYARVSTSEQNPESHHNAKYPRGHSFIGQKLHVRKEALVTPW